MSTSKQNVEDFDFIFKEAIRLFELRKSSGSGEEYKANFDNKAELLASIIAKPKDISNSNLYQKDFLVSSESRRRLKNIATRSLKSEGLTHIVSINDYIQSIQDSIYIHIMHGKKLDETGYASILSKANKRARYKSKEITYYLPFNSLIPKSKERIVLGNINIVHKEPILKKVRSDSYYDMQISDNNFNSYDSLLCISVPRTSDQMSKVRVNNVADLIYGIIQVFARHHNVDAKQLALINNPVKTNINFYIAKEKDEFQVRGKFKFEGNLDEFWELFEEDLNSHFGEIIEVLIDYSLKPRDKECLADRLIDAFYWFGEAIKDSNKNAKVIKLVTALERLITFSRSEDKITENFCNRIASSLDIFHGELDKYKDDLNKLYNLRSRLVHGSISVHKKYDLKLDCNPFELASRAILSICIAYYKMGLDLTNYEEKLEGMFDNLIEHCNNKAYNKKPMTLSRYGNHPKK